MKPKTHKRTHNLAGIGRTVLCQRGKLAFWKKYNTPNSTQAFDGIVLQLS
jgi:hypothetical protein